MNRRGFTLLELLVALALAGVVALLVYGAAQAAFDAEARLARERRALQAERAMRTLLEDALRNARSAPRPGDPAFILETGTSARGGPEDRLTFVTRGGFPPLTADADWRVTVEATPAGLAVSAVPLGVRAPPRIAGLVAGVTGLEVRVQAAGGGAWTGAWPTLAALPRAVRLTFWADTARAGLPLVVALPVGGGS